MGTIYEPSTFGATSGSGDNTTALQDWFTAVMGTAGAIGVVAGDYPYASPLVWDFASRAYGVKISFIKGLGKLTYAGTASGSKGLNIIVSGGTSIGSISAAGILIEDIDFYSNHDGIGFQVGSDNGYDVFEQCHFPRARIINANTAGTSGAITAVACRIVGMNQSQWDVPIFNCKAATNNTTAKGSGVALELVQVKCSTFNSPSPSNGALGVHYTNLSNSGLGFSGGNIFNAPDLENLEHGIYAETTTGAINAEVYVGGNIDLVGGGYPMSLKTGSGFFGSPIPSEAINWVCPPWSNSTSGVIKNPNTGFSTTGIATIVN